jgi:glycerophosphoryl diester phosphodiesterase
MTLNFAHRGASHEAPANTLAAFTRAAELGADGIELDVQLSRDGKVVVIHNLLVDATTDGKGRVRDKTLAQLKELDAGAWFSPAHAGQRIPTLGQVIDAVGQRLLLNVELKVQGGQDDGLAAACVRVLRERELLERVVVSSFSRLAIRRVRLIEPRLAIGYLYYVDPLLAKRPWPKGIAQPDALHPHHRLIDECYVRWARERGYRIHTWTVDDPGRMRHLVRLGVDMIITNRPELLAGALQQDE